MGYALCFWNRLFYSYFELDFLPFLSAEDQEIGGIIVIAHQNTSPKPCRKIQKLEQEDPHTHKMLNSRTLN